MTVKPQTNPMNPNRWELVKRYDKLSDPHYNKFLNKYIETPHIHDSTFPGEVRYPFEWEVPK
jgi:hypothetical protein